MDIYYTIESVGEAVYVERRSRFLGYAYPVKTKEEALARVAELAKKYYDARHVCWAYMLGAERTDYRSNDDGEPSGTAGKPILGQINSLELTDVVVAVVRYFGGVKLGTSGLIGAYREAARAALEKAGRKECHQCVNLSFTYPYMMIDKVMKVTRAEGVEVSESIYDNVCSMSIDVQKDKFEAVLQSLSAIDGLTMKNQNKEI